MVCWNKEMEYPGRRFPKNFLILAHNSYKKENMEDLTPHKNFAKTGLTLPPAPTPIGVYKPYLIDVRYLYVSGHGPVQNDKRLIRGRIGKDMNLEQGRLAAQ